MSDVQLAVTHQQLQPALFPVNRLDPEPQRRSVAAATSSEPPVTDGEGEQLLQPAVAADQFVAAGDAQVCEYADLWHRHLRRRIRFKDALNHFFISCVEQYFSMLRQ